METDAFIVMAAEDGRTARLRFAGMPAGFVTLSTEMIDDLIAELAKVRPHLRPAVPEQQEPLLRTVPVAGATVAFGRTPAGPLLCLRHPGLGWLRFQIDPGIARTFAARLVAEAGPATDPS